MVCPGHGVPLFITGQSKFEITNKVNSSLIRFNLTGVMLMEMMCFPKE